MLVFNVFMFKITFFYSNFLIRTNLFLEDIEG